MRLCENAHKGGRCQKIGKVCGRHKWNDPMTTLWKSAVQINVVKGCANQSNTHATFDHNFVQSRSIVLNGFLDPVWE